MFSLLLPSLKRPELLNLGLSSIVKQKIKYPLEIIVLNDGLDTDETKSICNKYKGMLNIRYIFTGKNNLKWRVPAFALNIGIKKSKGKFIIISSPEMYHLANNMTTVMTCLKTNRNVLATLDHILFDNIGSFTKGLLNNPAIDIFSALSLNKIVKNNHSLESAKQPFFLGLSKQILLDIGGYDEDFTGDSCDDDDLMSRLLLKGLHYVFLKGRVIHLYHGTVNNGQPKFDNLAWLHNYKLLCERKNIIVRNKNREWGKLYV